MQENIILGILFYRDCTSYDLMKIAEKSTNYFYTSSLGSINPALKRLLSANKISAKETVENGRAKKTYSITKLGEQTLKNWQESPIKLGKIKEEALVHLFFMNQLPKEKQLAKLEDFIAKINEQQLELKAMKSVYNSLEIPKEEKEKAFFQISTLNFGIEYFKFEKQWFSNLISQIKTT